MNKLAQSNITQLCTIVILNQFAIWITNRLKRSEIPTDEDLDAFEERALRWCNTQISLSLNLPDNPKRKQEWVDFMNKEAKRILKGLRETFQLCV